MTVSYVRLLLQLRDDDKAKRLSASPSSTFSLGQYTKCYFKLQCYIVLFVTLCNVMYLFVTLCNVV